MLSPRQWYRITSIFGLYLILALPLLTINAPQPVASAPLPAPTLQQPCVVPSQGGHHVYMPFVYFRPQTTMSFQPKIEVNEAVGKARLTFNLSFYSTNVVSLTVNMLDGMATANNDYTAISQTLKFSNGQASFYVDIPIINDSQAEGTESFTVQIKNVQGAVAKTHSATITIIDDDTRINVQTSMNIPQVSSYQAYQWLTTVTPDADAVNTTATPTTIGYRVHVERGSLGSPLYLVSGMLTIANTGNIAVNLEQTQLELQYQLGTSTWISDAQATNVDLGTPMIARGASLTVPFSVTFGFATPDGRPPANLSALKVVSLINIIDTNGVTGGPFHAQQLLSTSLPSPITKFSTVTLKQTGVVSPSTGFNVTGGNATPTVVGTTPFDGYTTYSVTRATTATGSLEHQVLLQENEITVNAQTALQTSQPSDLPTIQIQEFDPIAAYLNEATPFTITARIRPGLGLNADNIWLVQRDANGAITRSLGQLKDDGLHNDELASDGIYGIIGTASWNTLGNQRLAVQAILLNNTFLFDEHEFAVIKRKTDAELKTYYCVVDQGHAQFATAIQTMRLSQAQQATLAWIQSRQGVTQARLASDEIFVQFASGLETFINVGDPKSIALGGGSNIPPISDTQTSSIVVVPSAVKPAIFPLTNRAAVINTIPLQVDPYNSQYRSLQTMLQKAGYQVSVFNGQQATVDLFKSLFKYGVIVYFGHGGGWEDPQTKSYRLSSGQLAPPSGNIDSDASIQKLVALGMIYADKREGILIYHLRTSFFQAFYPRTGLFPNTLWIVNGCRLLEQQDFANLMHARGVAAMVGFTSYIWIQQTLDMSTALLYGMLTKEQNLAEAMNAIPLSKRSVNWNPFENTRVTTTFAYSQGSASNLKLIERSLVNGNFESGTTAGWQVKGRKLVNVFLVPYAYRHLAQTQQYAARLGPATYPPANGVGHTVADTDQLVQRVTVPRGTKFLSFHYAMTAYLPANGAFVVKIYQGNSNVLLYG